MRRSEDSLSLWDLLQRGEFEKVIVAIDTRLRAVAVPEEVPARWFSYRGHAYYYLGRFVECIESFEKAISQDNAYWPAHASLAYVLATCPDASFLDGHRAIHHAAEACELTEWREWEPLSCLAAAYARIGNYNEAEKIALDALCSARDARGTARIEKLIALIRAGQPYTARLEADIEKLKAARPTDAQK
jgi:tetratricopeptide (TPR) repeat protein